MAATLARLPTTSPSRRRRASIELVEGRDHYEKVVLEAVCRARVSVWIATANVKDVHVEAPLGSTARARGRFVSILEGLSDLVQSGVDVRILHGGSPSLAFSDSLRKLRGLKGRGFEMRRCPRVHLKIVAVDGSYLYLGSANFTGAGLGAKGEGRRNFELGIDTDDDLLLDAAQLQFDRIWNGRECASCRLRDQCPAPLDGGAHAKKDDPRRVSAARRPRAAKARRA
jgi:phosphatidylserine/phosphatidylglycerophosphate/cardiolipin synthase-like enzyme